MELGQRNQKGGRIVLYVLCGMVNTAYQRPDGVFVVPVAALKE